MQNNYKKIIQASLLIALSGILYGFLGFLGTYLLKEKMTIGTMLFWRFSIAGSWMLIFVIKKNSIQAILNQVPTRTLTLMFILGAVGYAGSSEFYFIASQYTGTGLAMVIFFSYPMIIALASWMIYRKSFNIITSLTLITMTIGLFLLYDSSTNQFNLLGIFFGVIAALCYAFYVMGSKYISTSAIHSNLLTAIVCFACAFIFLMISIASQSFVFPHSIKACFYLLALGIVATALPIQLMLEGLKEVSSMRASIISVLEPLVTIWVGILLLDEAVSPLQIIGITIILSSALLVQLQKEL